MQIRGTAAPTAPSSRDTISKSRLPRTRTGGVRRRRPAGIVWLFCTLLISGFVLVVAPGAEAEAAGQSFVPVTPARILDTRGGGKVGALDGSGAARELRVFGQGGLPSGGIAAVALNVTAVEGENPLVGGGFVTVYPCGTRPDASNLNFVGGQTIPNAVIAPVSSGGDVCLYVYGKAHLLVDVSGYLPSGTGFSSVTPARILDTRGGGKVGALDGSGAARELRVFGQGGLPSGGIAAVALNVTAVEGENPLVGGGFVTVYPCGTRPDASNLNFVGGQTIPNAVIAPVSSGGDVCLYVYGKAHLLVDVSGYLPSGTGFSSVTPARILDTRGGGKVGALDGSGAARELRVFGQGGLPSGGIAAVALNVTAVEGENPLVGGGFVTVYPCGTRPDASNLNFVGGQTIPNAVIAPVSSGGDVCLYVYGKAHLLVDVSGYFVGVGVVPPGGGSGTGGGGSGGGSGSGGGGDSTPGDPSAVDLVISAATTTVDSRTVAGSTGGQSVSLFVSSAVGGTTSGARTVAGDVQSNAVNVVVSAASGGITTGSRTATGTAGGGAVNLSVSAASGGVTTGSRVVSGDVGGVAVNLSISSAASVTGSRTVTGTVGGLPVAVTLSAASSETAERTVVGVDPTAIAPVIAVMCGNGVFW